ncbi:3-isopropylmalate dehydrogenase [Burkholderia ubonensis]|uniref:3-isopropylmalate dehydrogenase n=1 Tax=Burkholderia ubonensis subsp. mesacidophila TaxID=265293 RepID=A0A2A4FMM7_9BURK|nr:3-isopropylmalate dehydrogenase [Burkholderia ubonensis]PCE33908.1 3-isopropylmalate dehydrogenase [Burkholderia ubonensis subsp. mesacidophila]
MALISLISPVLKPHGNTARAVTRAIVITKTITTKTIIKR